LYSDIVPWEFFGAQPTVLHARYAFISTCRLVTTADAPARFLARVCDLRIIKQMFDAHSLGPTDVALVSGGAAAEKVPHLSVFAVALVDRPQFILRSRARVRPARHERDLLQGDASWLAPTAPPHPALEGLVHPRLRVFGDRTPRAAAPRTSESTPPDDVWARALAASVLFFPNQKPRLLPKRFRLMPTG
jgi:hypothetical protein